MDTYLLCGMQTGGLLVGMKPDTATVRVLSVDGGGSRARIPLEFLQRLQDCVGLPYRVQCNFDFVFGTSCGLDPSLLRSKQRELTPHRCHGCVSVMYQPMDRRAMHPVPRRRGPASFPETARAPRVSLSLWEASYSIHHCTDTPLTFAR